MSRIDKLKDSGRSEYGAHTLNLIVRAAEADGSLWITDQPGLLDEFQASMDRHYGKAVNTMVADEVWEHRMGVTARGAEGFFGDW